MTLSLQISRAATFAAMVVLATSIASSAVEPAASVKAASEPGRLAVRTLEFPSLVDSQREDRRVPLKVHVPEGVAAYPLIVMSHGAGGSWDANFAQARHLASHGYLVVCIEHVGSNTERILRGGRLAQNLRDMMSDSREILTRPKDVSFAIDRVTEWNASHAELKGRFDLEHIGMMGHSFGAYTTLVICGMRPALDHLVPRVEPGMGLGPDLSDPRVDCGVALSPQGPGEQLFLPESYTLLNRPLLGISGSRDQQLHSTPLDRKQGFDLWPAGDRYLLWLTNAEHSAFSDSTGSGKRMLPSNSRTDAQPVSRAATLFFLDAYLKSSATAKEQLTAAALQPLCQGVISSLELLQK